MSTPSGRFGDTDQEAIGPPVFVTIIGKIGASFLTS